VLVGGGGVAAEGPQALSACTGEVIGNGVVANVADGRTFTLQDGRDVRLAGIESPLAVAGSPSPAETTARDALGALVLKGEVTLKQAAPNKSDRYGRLVAYAFIGGAGGRLVQDDLLAAGWARVAARVGGRICAMELLNRENGARQAKLGLWAGSEYGLLSADNPTAVLAERGRFALVEGKVLSVRESGATIYVNFGRRWSEDFTVTILKRNERNFTAVGLDPKMLAGRQIRVRGWIEEHGGPEIGAVWPEQIELADRQ
jgi:endonuclease YncB( thermonuclease family)